ncbi:MAG TPA: type II toxin-antitoxin system RelB/DinJ family antitoxin [Candidatus Kaiserbacteria bacterium]|nr:type II toxin-antitoxin system RelB/DinJ family antitoxin [Candidatus Kaiserbacteria bacterium]
MSLNKINTNTTLQVRIDRKTKNKAQKVFKDMGIDMSSGIKLFLSRVINTESIPFIPVTKNGFTKKEEETVLKEIIMAKKTGRAYSSVSKAFEDVLK